jgi:hypothetical protein
VGIALHRPCHHYALKDLGLDTTRLRAADSKINEIHTESSYVATPWNAVGQLPFPAFSVCSHTSNAGTVLLGSPLRYSILGTQLGDNGGHQTNDGENIDEAQFSMLSGPLGFVFVANDSTALDKNTTKKDVRMKILARAATELQNAFSDQSTVRAKAVI